MGVGETFVAMGVIIMVTTLGIIWLVTGNKTRRRALAASQSDGLARELAATQAELRAVKERVRVLEALVTDPDNRLAREIDQLGKGEAAR